MELLHDIAEVPEPLLMLVEDSVQVRLVLLTAAVRSTVPVKPFVEFTVRILLPVLPALILTLLGLAVRV